MKLFVNNKEVTNVSNLEWSDDLENIADTISFDTDLQIEPASQFVLYDGKTIVLTGIISEYRQQKKDIFSYSGYDFGFYLSRNSIVKQFNGTNISDAMKSLCRDFNIPAGSVANLSATVKEIYKNKTLLDCFKELLNLAQTKTGKDCYYMTCSDGKFNVKKYQLIENLTGACACIFEIDSNNTVHDPNLSVSMEEMRNRVIVVDSEKKITTTKYIAQDSKNIAKYGLLQHIEELDKDSKNNAANIAKTKLSELNKLKTTLSLTMLGDYRMRKGVIVPLKNKDFDLDGDFLITSSKHNPDGIKETVTVNLIKYPRANLS